ncbi:MAG: type I-C CRISPR-associated protein Cas8c/Csd1 [Coleofasciculaceae cyanobacterium SM2_1_6]|nr:type I-C CRISPR-associated protein Cas8c/Csd1 [Coleofasciculaceae cyanobacterium SM2_1_6]
MILTKLKEYADMQMTLPPAMYMAASIRWLINLNPDGTLQSFTPRGGNTKVDKRGEIMVVPHITRAMGVKPKLLADNGEYVLGIGRSESKPDRVKDCHNQFKALVQKCAEITKEPSVQVIVKFLESWNPEAERDKLPPDFDPSDNLTFSALGIIPADEKAGLLSIQEFWADYTAGGGDGETKDLPIMTCLVTGELKPVVDRMPVFIKKLIGGQPSGTVLVSANAPPFTSYGLKNSLTSPISRDAAEKFAKALNHLIAAPDSKLNIGTTTYVAWTREPSEEVAETWEFLDKPDPQAVINLLNSAEKGQQTYGTDANQFYVLALTANSSRVVIRDWLEMTVPEVKSNLRTWFTAQKIVDSYGEQGIPLSVYHLASSAYRDAAKEMLPTVTIALTRVALYGGKLPLDLLARLIRRNRVEQDVTYYRAALIKLIFTTQNEQFAIISMENLNPDPELNPEDRSAYHCGRLLAELEATQRAALGKINASLTDRYYGAASSNPASAFPPLLRGARAHLSKLRKNQSGTCNALEESLEEITSHLDSFPKTMTMQNQGLFALGYYHQRAKNRAAAKAAIASKQTQE